MKTAIFWVVMMLMVLHWFCCTWGILALIQMGQRTDELLNIVSHECIISVNVARNTSFHHQPECLHVCEAETLALESGVSLDYGASTRKLP